MARVFDLKASPYIDSAKVGTIYRDDIFIWLREVVQNQLDPNRINQSWVETPKGLYLYALCTACPESS